MMHAVARPKSSAPSPSPCCWLRAAALMSSIYEDHKDEDGFLYITYSGENTFGALLEELPEDQQELGQHAADEELAAAQPLVLAAC